MSRQLAVDGGSSSVGQLAVFTRGQRERIPIQYQLLSALKRRPLQEHPRLADRQKPADDQLAGGQSMLRGSSSGGVRALQNSQRHMLFRCTIDYESCSLLSP
ncbi:hypothetical protein CTAM01_16738 [Colletotrichum tamarilloi]|uniref:Uncharacterized protein n=1 Tax=Colletotrichum tamarilloi TaxID=1209934 RepID=A0ABQ9QHN2_9PEZI|nr:uncharacterized protein CTAM01_16738 [Colletotrichum tamarilloi]KAK1470630.1 hypothetical protein CTAM01_16738 [Colletotrichum tamarilloi]